MAEHTTTSLNQEPSSPNKPVQTPTSPPNDSPVQPAKQSKIASLLNPFKSSSSSTQKRTPKDIPPALQDQIRVMEKRKKAKLAELEAQGRKPNNKTSMAYGISALGGTGV